MAISSDSGSSTSGLGNPAEALAEYIREHTVHIGVILLLAAYPGLHHILVNTPIGEELALFLPRVETMVSVFYFGLFAISFDFISGYTGYLSFGHAAFYGTGGYLVVLIANERIPFLPSTTPFMISLAIVGVVAVGLAILIGAVSFRLTGVYFAMITLGFAQVLYVFIRNWDYVGSNPRSGISVLGHPEGFRIGVPFVDSLNVQIASADFIGQTFENLFGLGINLSASEVSYYMIGVVVVLCYFVMKRMLHSPFGQVMVAIRENEERARAIGYNTFRYKLAAFAISGFFAAVAGGLFAGYRRSVTPENSFFFLVTGDALLAAIIGGFGTLAGPFFGRLFHEFLREFLSDQAGGPHIDVGELGLLPYLRRSLGEGALNTEIYNEFTVGQFIETFLNGHESLYLGILFVLFVLYVPEGILGTLRKKIGGKIEKKLPEKFKRAVKKRVRGAQTKSE